MVNQRETQAVCVDKVKEAARKRRKTLEQQMKTFGTSMLKTPTPWGKLEEIK